MAKVNMSYDTETKEFNLEINGEKINNVSSMYVYKEHMYKEEGEEEEENEMYCSITTMEKGDGVNKSVTYHTTSSLEAKQVDQAQAVNNIPGFVGKKDIGLESLAFSFSKFKK